MNHGILPRALLAAALLLAPLAAAAQVPVPQLRARVTDLTSTLSADERAALEQKLAAIEARKGSQVAVLLVPTTQPETVEQYAIRVFDQWKLGRKAVDDGVLLLVAKNDRKLRIEVGRGLEGAIPDAFAKRIIEEEITPQFKQGHFAGGISAGVDRVAKLIEGESMPPPARTPAGSGSGLSDDVIVYGLFAMLALASVLQSVLGRLLGSLGVAVAASVIVYVLAGLGLAVVVAIAVFFISLLAASSSGGSGWSSGGSGGYSGGGSWSSGGGGFSGGGGSSGGGGASGSW